MRISDWSSDVCSSDLGSRQSRTQGCIIHTVVHVGQDCLTWLNRQYGIERGSEMDMRGMRPFPQCVDHPDVSPAKKFQHSIGKNMEVCRSEEHTSELQSLMRI